jgi:nucleotide-binding universal stress UspA family protein
MFKKIVVALDGSHCAEQALEVALRLAETERAELGICSVVDPVMVMGTTPPSPALDLMVADAERATNRRVTSAVEKARAKGVVASGELRRGLPASQILAYAREFGADAIVMGTHGRGGVRRLLMGSVAEAALREAPVPVIVVRERERVDRAHRQNHEGVGVRADR